MTLITLIFGKEKHGVEVDDTKGELTPALIEKEKERRRWWKPWKRFEIDGYEDPFSA